MAVRLGVFEPLLDEHDYTVDQIDGTLPRDLTGTLYRIGPGKWQVGTTMLANLLDGDGMVSQFILDGKSVHFRNRYVRTPQYVGGLNSAKMRQPGIGSLRPGGRLANVGRIPANTANTNISYHAGNLLALWEGGHPYRLEPDSLETLGEYDFEGRLRRLDAFSAHPKWDPDTGEMFNFGLVFFPSRRLLCYRVDTTGRLHRLATVRLPDLPSNHDFALTRKHLVFVLDPIMPNVRKIVLAECPLMEALDYRPRLGTRFVLVPRDGGRPRIVEHDALLHLHVTNAYEEGEDTVVDLVRYDSWDDLTRAVLPDRGPSGADFTSYANLPASRLVRYRITPEGRVIEHELAPYCGEFPQFDWRFSTRRHGFSYLAARTAPTGPYDTALKIDHDRDEVTLHRVGEGNLLGEPIFVSRTPDAAEDDGWLLAVNYDPAEHRSQLVVLDAADLERGPLAVAHLRHHVPFGLHGTFTRRVADAGAPIPDPDRLPTR